jgi:cytochrome c peroxidase
VKKMTSLLHAAISALMISGIAQASEDKEYVFEAGHPSLQEWLLPDEPPYPENNKPSAARTELGKSLFFDPRLSGDGSISCATCHNPMLGWSDALPTGVGFKGATLHRASPTVINTGYNSIQMWDGRKKSLEDQATGPMEASVEMKTDFPKMLAFLENDPDYAKMFDAAYPGEGVNNDTLARAIAAYERTIISNNSPFDHWVKGDKNAMTAQQVNGFKLFVGKANCSVCHSAPNFTDNGFHNLGLKSWGVENPDMGRYGQKPIKILKGAFKTPTIRDIERTAPYFHDGSAYTLAEVVEHYNKGGEVKQGISPNMKELGLTEQEKADVVAFMQALTSPFIQVTLPEIPYKNSPISSMK